MYRQIDEENILSNLDRLEEQATAIKLNKYEPTLTEINNVRNEILQFIKNKKRIIYGGYAQNSLIMVKNKNDAFYKPTDLADIEFYSPDPIGDLIDLCDLINKKGYKYVEGKEGVHPETYKFYSNFNNYSDITYMPPLLFNNCPTINIDGILMAHPHLMLIDAYRVYTDPMTSYFRLKKTFTRFNKLIKYYPLKEDMIYNKIEPYTTIKKDKNDEILYFIRKQIIHKSKMIVTGHYAFNQLMKIAKVPGTYLIDTTYYQLISTDYNNDINKITNILKKKYPSVVIKKYYPFYQYLDKSTEFFIEGTMVLRVYGTNDRCIVYRYSEKKHTYFASYQLIFMYSLINYNIALMRNNKYNISSYGSMMIRLMKARDKYLEQHNLTVLDKSIFQEFTFDCIGEPKDILRESFLQKNKKREQGKRVQFLYKPTGNPGKKPNFKFDISTGDIIK
jgi:hypothetical protein